MDEAYTVAADRCGHGDAVACTDMDRQSVFARTGIDQLDHRVVAGTLERQAAFHAFEVELRRNADRSRRRKGGARPARDDGGCVRAEPFTVNDAEHHGRAEHDGGEKDDDRAVGVYARRPPATALVIVPTVDRLEPGRFAAARDPARTAERHRLPEAEPREFEPTLAIVPRRPAGIETLTLAIPLAHIVAVIDPH
ncbi:hypothetical protein WR25_26005 [Diploscapter pachys]|uniref:Uncharacterized protein n=1 Tax=Diploscapter pachys TaxID=2018661 RepID=A0A2A2K524_9BILA|nr:hypothetical protein WR25_26005 [Diploscapter pachys]